MDFSSVCVEAMPSITNCSFVMRVSRASQISPSAGPPRISACCYMADGCHLGLRPALHRGGVQGLLLQPLAQRVVGLQADHAVELRPVARDEAYPADHHVVDPPTPVAHVQAVVERDLPAPPGHHLRAHGGDPAGQGDPARLPPERARRALADLRRGGRLDKLRRELPDAVRPRDPLGVLQRAARAAAEEDPGHRRGGAPAGVLNDSRLPYNSMPRFWVVQPTGRSATLATLVVESAVASPAVGPREAV